MKPKSLPLGSKTLETLAKYHPITYIDIGARAGATGELDFIKKHINFIGIDADAAECARLNSRAKENAQGYLSQRFYPIVIGAKQENRRFFECAAPGCSSLLKPNHEIAESFGRQDDYRIRNTTLTDTMPLDEAATLYDFGGTHFLKLDAQGASYEILESGQHLLEDSILGLRVEMENTEIYLQQALWHKVHQLLTAKGFKLAGFLEKHEWRRYSRARLDRLQLATGEYPFSRGEFIHFDGLYFLDPKHIFSRQSSSDASNAIRLAMISMALGYVDHARYVAEQADLETHCLEKHGVSFNQAISEVSMALGRRWRKDQLRAAWRHLRASIVPRTR